MTRTDVLKGVYFGRLAGLVVSATGAMVAARSGAAIVATALGALFAALLLSGRVQALFWSELLAGLHALNQRDYRASKTHSERFLALLHARPWLKHLIWLGTSSYSLDAEVLALNNLGAAESELGDFAAAQAHFDQAIALDPECPLPYRNMGRLVLRTATTAEAMPWLEKAIALGRRGDLSDRAVMASQRRNAELSTTGAVSDHRLPLTKEQPPVIGAFIIYLLNDDTTPFEFAVEALEKVFGLTGFQAIAIAQQVNRLGRAPCNGFDDGSAAEDKAEELRAFASAHGHSLACVVEPASA